MVLSNFNEIFEALYEIYAWFFISLSHFFSQFYRVNPLMQTSHYIYFVLPCFYLIFDFILYVAFNNSNSFNLKFNITRKVFSFVKNQKEKRLRTEFSINKSALSSDLSTLYYFKPCMKQEKHEKQENNKYVPRNKEGKMVNIDIEPD